MATKVAAYMHFASVNNCQYVECSVEITIPGTFNSYTHEDECSTHTLKKILNSLKFNFGAKFKFLMQFEPCFRRKVVMWPVKYHRVVRKSNKYYRKTYFVITGSSSIFLIKLLHPSAECGIIRIA